MTDAINGCIQELLLSVRRSGILHSLEDLGTDAPHRNVDRLGALRDPYLRWLDPAQLVLLVTEDSILWVLKPVPTPDRRVQFSHDVATDTLTEVVDNRLVVLVQNYLMKHFANFFQKVLE